jgi:hypothetical protein
LTATHWRSPDGSLPRFGAIPIDEKEVVPENGLKAIKPKEEFEGYAGNAGMTLERWYRRAAVLLWPNKRHLNILCEAGSQQAVPALARMVSAWLKAEGPEAAAQKKQCVKFAKMILAQWPENLESNILSARSDLDCTTNKRPRPQILICTKNMASYDRQLKEFHENLNHLTALRSLNAALSH